MCACRALLSMNRLGWVAFLALTGCQCGAARIGAVSQELHVSPEALDFGEVELGATSTLKLALTNHSIAALTIDSVDVEGTSPTAYQPHAALPLRIAAGETSELSVTYAPAHPGQHRAQLVIASSATAVEVSLTGVAKVLSDAGFEEAKPPDAGQVDAGQVDAGAGCANGLFRCAAGCCPASDLSAGARHACALVRDTATTTEVKCWGQNTFGQLGNGQQAPRSMSPVKVKQVPVTMETVKAGGDFTCALSSAGAVYCWGNNNAGQLGNGATSSSSEPVKVALTEAAIELSVGFCSACVRTSSGAMACWGCNDFGELGNGTRAAQRTPTTVTGLESGVVALSEGGGESHTCGTRSSGEVKCWGYNGFGQLGTGTTTSDVLVPVTATEPPASARLVAGVSRSFALSANGTLVGWGRNDHGQLGNGTQNTAPTGHEPPPVLSPVEVLGGPYAQVSASGQFHTCGVTLSGEAKCWGLGGLVGDGSTSERLAPVSVSGLNAGIKHLSVGGSVFTGFTCALNAAGGVQCWGGNAEGELGNGTTTAALAPVFIVDQ